jgi:3-oxoacyl-[acyl-carrier-protein] synthase III
MNGRQVFNFALVKVPAHLHELLDASGLKSSDIDAFCIHQGSAAIVDAVARRFRRAAPGEVLKDMLETGNTVSSSVPLLLQAHARQQLEARGHQWLRRGPVVGLGDSLSRLIRHGQKSAWRVPPGVFFCLRIRAKSHKPLIS